MQLFDFLLVYIYVFWLVFIVAMAAKATWPTLTPLAKVMIAPVGLLGVLLDAFFNIFIATFLLLDFPQEFMFTHRLDRYEGMTGWRQTFALWFCRNFLNPFQIGGHCTR
jgi:hypothetical protein